MDIMWGRVYLTLLLKCWWKTLPTETQRHTTKQISVPWGSPMGLRSITNPIFIPLGKLRSLGLAEAQVNCMKQLGVQHLSVV